ncbi:MAG: 23S rRNA (uracil(1939)-C(5))-methyltransferase RlmD [Desulfuromonadaceae bacterium]|nr:23S rRNA (uracil(1939)-C(5))-methyltransferase RlmD [Desulfuromonas sp.]MDY0184572.1 23S rRNA (uracil(1939)-C(5))-methyltransferase RlmD [Desulfuromonadaceae bacterium]
MSDSAETKITSLVHGGAGLGQLPDGRTVFIPLSVPGDQVRYRIRKEYKRYAKAELEEVLRPSTHRFVPECKYFGVCGGCDWQMLSYSSQCEWKQRLLHQSLVHNLGDEAAATLDSFLPAASPSGYRCRAQLKCSNLQDCFLLGFYRLGTHRVVGVDSCLILHPLIDALLSPLQHLFNKTCYAAHVEQIDAAVDDSGCTRMSTRLVIHYTGIDVKEFASWLKTRVHEWDVAVLVSDRRPPKVHKNLRGSRRGSGRKLPSSERRLICVQGDAEFKLDIGVPALTLTCAPGHFTQVNLAQNRRLVELVVKLATANAETDEKSVGNTGNIIYDLYCGVGNFALPLSFCAAEVVGVEANSGAIAQARKNAELASITNARFVCADVAEFLTQSSTAGEFPPPTTVVLDPPRVGAKEVAAALPATGVGRIVYVSCDQQTLMRDLKILVAAGYELHYIRGLDMFPHTHHCEVVALLERSC